MITVITNESKVTSNPYPGMSLAEACGAMEVAVMEAVNELQMDVLISEHSYLYANGTEMEYTNEAGEINENGASLKQKVIDTITSIGDKIRELWDKAAEWAMQAIANAKAWLTKQGIKEADVRRINRHANEVFKEQRLTYSSKYDFDKSFNPVDVKARDESYLDLMTGKKSDAGDIMGVFVSDNSHDIAIDEEVFNTAVEVVLHDTIVKGINNAKKQANEALKDAIKQIKQAKPDDMNAQIAGLKENMAANTKITKAMIKVYHLYMNENIGIVRTVLTSEQGRKAIRSERAGDAKAAVKSAPLRAAMTARAVPDNAKAAANKAGEKVKGAVDAVKEKGSRFFPTKKGKKEEE